MRRPHARLAALVDGRSKAEGAPTAEERRVGQRPASEPCPMMCEQDPEDEDQFSWTCGLDKRLAHCEPVGSGGFAEVYKVMTPPPPPREAHADIPS